MKLIILAAGRGTRFLPKTQTTPKGMVLISGEPLLMHVVEPYLPHVSDIIFVISSPLGKKIKDYFGKNYQGHQVFYKVQKEQKGTMDALLTCTGMIEPNELFCVANGDDLLKEADIRRAMGEGVIGMGVSEKIMPKSYLGIELEGKNILGFTRHETREDETKDIFYNGFNILDSKVFWFRPILTRDGEEGLPQSLFANLDTYPLRAFHFDAWETVNKPEDIKKAEKFLKS